MISDEILQKLPPRALSKLGTLRQEFEEAKILSSAAHVGALDVRKASGRQQIAADMSDLYRSRTTAFVNLLASIEAWLLALPPDARLSEHPAVKVQDVTLDKIEGRRRRIRELLADLAQIDAAPYPVAALKLRTREKIEALAERGCPSIDIEDIDAPIVWPTRSVEVIGRGIMKDPIVTDTEAMFAWLFKKELITALDREIAETADEACALADATRCEKFKTVLSDLLETEREEEAFVCAAGFAGFVMLRRFDADPRAVLGLASSLPGPGRNLRHHNLIASMMVSKASPTSSLRFGG